uniref:Uncharacterized protein n=1 Tax=Anopheles coluzzii TaxID=1518534 RepID=A0A8W7P071_ANOCL
MSLRDCEMYDRTSMISSNTEPWLACGFSPTVGPLPQSRDRAALQLPLAVGAPDAGGAGVPPLATSSVWQLGRGVTITIGTCCSSSGDGDDAPSRFRSTGSPMLDSPSVIEPTRSSRLPSTNTVPVCTPTRILMPSFRCASNTRIDSIMPSPISTQQIAWSGRGSGHPDTQ